MSGRESASRMGASAVRVGLISDTHDLLRPQALAFLQGSHFIVHAGDICQAGVLETLAAVAPVTAVRGNNDRGAWAEHLPHTAVLQVGGVRICVIHDLGQLGTWAVAADAQVVVSGHSHKPFVERRNGVLHVNPGSAGPRRFKLPVAVAELNVDGASVTARITELHT